MKFAIAGGGTGGHLFPALAVGEVLLERGHEVLIFISEKEVDALAIQGRDEFRFEKLPSVGMPRLFSPAIFTFFQRFNASLAPCRRIFAEFQPDAVLGMGGFTSTPPILAGKLRRIPTFVHESNAIPGKANRLNARLVDVVLLGFEECKRHFPRARCEVTGTPIRRSLSRRLPREEALAVFGLQPGMRTLLVMGGSQGAHGINEALRAAAAGGGLAGIQVIHLTGAGDAPAMEQAYRQAGVSAHVAPFCHQMEAAYSAADLVVSRSGAASLSEISHFALPSLLIPYPHAAENHQQFNAEIFARAGAAEVLKESQTTGDTLASAIGEIIEDPSRLQIMAKACGTLAPRDAAVCVADTIERLK
ncbi:MAG: undecaprenyldiphospho-muramoylpentapeptide beta-N-acetylglucosaminyltransferase [Chthoniobacteraceae bacterium]|nr:undecaprenyldiphospho-muramoylpentapeptide beta-N-acetylglucosaminyltransferase [Chthoniobacteraceae bacterium]